MKVLIKEKLSPHKYKDNSGYLICTDCILARTGKQSYTRDELFGYGGNEEIDVDREEKEVFDPRTLASFENKPLTIEHPNEDVNPSNYNDLAVGYIRDIHKGEYEGQPVMLGTIVITNQEAIEDVESGSLTNLSCGYDCDVDDCEKPCQKNIRGNHVALCEIPRAGITRIVDSKKRRRKDSMDLNKIAKEIETKGRKYLVKKYGLEDFLNEPEYILTTKIINDYIQVSGEYDYEEFEDFIDNVLNPIIQKYDKDSYFEMVEPGIAGAYVNSYIQTKDSVSNENIKQWYHKAYPTDDEYEWMNDDITFKKLLEEMTSFYTYPQIDPGDVYYRAIGAEDSLIRERIFEKLAEILNVNYDVIYNLWLGDVEEISDEDMKKLGYDEQDIKHFAEIEKHKYYKDKGWIDSKNRKKDAYSFLPSSDYTDEEKRFARMAESVIAYDRNHDIEHLLSDEYLQDYDIPKRRKIEILNEMLDDLVEVRENVHTDNEGLSYNSTIYKDYPLYTGISFNEENEEEVRDLIHKYGLEDYAQITNGKYHHKNLSFEISNNERINRKLSKKAYQLMEEIYDMYF